MAEWLKRAVRTAETEREEIGPKVRQLLASLEAGGEAAAREMACQFDGWSGEVVVSEEALARAVVVVPEGVKADIRFAHDNVRRFAEAQLSTVGEVEIELMPGLYAGQKLIPVGAAGCYVPGGRYAHVASALMTITTAKVAGVAHVTAASPPRAEGIPAAMLYAMHLAGADAILNMGGVQAVAAMAGGMFGLPRADILVGPGNAYVAEAKRVLYGAVGIDMVAGPTDVLILADAAADAGLVAADLVGQAEHGATSPVWLVTESRKVAEGVLERVPALIDALPEPNRSAARAAWNDCAEVVVCADREEMAAVSDRYAPEHLHVQAADLGWWLTRLRAYGSLFLGEEVTVAYGDKAAGPNHVLPTGGAARYTGGLSVHKFLKAVTWQRGTREGTKALAGAVARISRLEGMEGHARTADVRLAKYFPEERFDLGI